MWLVRDKATYKAALYWLRLLGHWAQYCHHEVMAGLLWIFPSTLSVSEFGKVSLTTGQGRIWELVSKNITFSKYDLEILGFEPGALRLQSMTLTTELKHAWGGRTRSHRAHLFFWTGKKMYLSHKHIHREKESQLSRTRVNSAEPTCTLSGYWTHCRMPQCHLFLNNHDIWGIVFQYIPKLDHFDQAVGLPPLGLGWFTNGQKSDCKGDCSLQSYPFRCDWTHTFTVILLHP